MRRFIGPTVVLLLTVTLSMVAVPAGSEAGQIAIPSADSAACDGVAQSFVTSARPCVIRCSDLTGCQKCCVEKGGWVCTPL